jgi:hypothetical protein
LTPSWNNQESQTKSMSVMIQSSFSLSNLSPNVDNGDTGSLVAAVHNLDSLKKELSNKNPAKKALTHKKIKFWQAPNA